MSREPAGSLAAVVRRRAGGCCEYCHFPETAAELPFQVDHIIALKHGGETSDDNLAYACFYCNSYKGPNIAGVDPASSGAIRLFHPRRDRWADHFQWDGTTLGAKTAVGRVTIAVLRLNHPDAITVREALLAVGSLPEVSRKL